MILGQRWDWHQASVSFDGVGELRCNKWYRWDETRGFVETGGPA